MVAVGPVGQRRRRRTMQLTGLVVCPRCGYLAVRCAEEGSFFAAPRDLVRSVVQAEATTCPQCQRPGYQDFVAATENQVRQGGLRPGEYT